jgi:hypothetical protein
MMLAGVPLPDQLVLTLAEQLREADFTDTAARLEEAYEREVAVVALTIPEGEQILRALEDCPDGLGELRAVLTQEHVWRKREGLV